MSRSKDDTLRTHNNIHNRLKEMVNSWELPPGAYLAVGRLAEQLNVSTTPVREALMRLCGEGLVECIASRGFFVKSLDVYKIEEIYDIGFALLTHSVSRVTIDAARRLFAKSTLWESEWESCANTFFDSPAQAAFYIERIYSLIASLSSSSELHCLVKGFNSRTRIIRLTELQEHARREANRLEMSKIVHGLAEGATDRAGDALHAHICRVRVHLPTVAQDALSRSHRIDLATTWEQEVIGRKRLPAERLLAENNDDDAWCATARQTFSADHL